MGIDGINNAGYDGKARYDELKGVNENLANQLDSVDGNIDGCIAESTSSIFNQAVLLVRSEKAGDADKLRELREENPWLDNILPELFNSLKKQPILPIPKIDIPKIPSFGEEGYVCCDRIDMNPTLVKLDSIGVLNEFREGLKNLPENERQEAMREWLNQHKPNTGL